MERLYVPSLWFPKSCGPIPFRGLTVSNVRIEGFDGAGIFIGRGQAVRSINNSFVRNRTGIDNHGHLETTGDLFR
jgi:hypothetical protein